MSPHVLKGARNVFEQTRAENETNTSTKYPERQSWQWSVFIYPVLLQTFRFHERHLWRGGKRDVFVLGGEKKKVSCHWTHILFKRCSSCSSLTDNILKNNWPKEFLTKLGHECMEHWKNLKTNQTCLLWFMYNGIQETVSLGFSLFDLPAKKYNHVVVFSTRAPIVNFLFYFLHTSGSCCCSNADLEFLVSVKASFKLCDSWLKNPKL